MLRLMRPGARAFSTSAVLLKVEKPILPSTLQFKVGQIRLCERHPNADKLYVSQISIGEEDQEPLTVCSGLVDYVPIDQMQGKRVVVMTNLKPVKMRGIRSEAMVLAAEKVQGDTVEAVELVEPPSSGQIGQELVFKDYGFRPDPLRLLSSRTFGKIQSKLLTNDQGTVVYRTTEDHPLLLKGTDDPCTVPSAFNSVVR